MKNYIVRVYEGSEFTETEIGSKQSFSVGSDSSCIATFDFINIINFNFEDNIWYYNADKHVTLKGSQQTKGTIKNGEILLIDGKSRTAVTILPVQPKYEKVIDFNDLKSISIGRNEDCDISIQSKQVSGKHAQFMKKSGSWIINDMGSSNGIFINNKLSKEKDLKSGDIIDISMCRIIYTDTGLFIRSHDAVTSNITIVNKLPSIMPENIEYPHNFKRSPRLKCEIPSGEIEIHQPPSVGTKPTTNWLTVLLPPIGMSVVMLLTMVLNSSGSLISLAFTLPMTLISVIVSVVNYNTQKNKHAGTTDLREKKYKEYLDKIIKEINIKQDEQREKLSNVNATSEKCIETVQQRSRELWDRKPNDNDFMTLRVGSGNVLFNVNIKTPKQAFSLEDDPLFEEGVKIAEKYRLVGDCPILFDVLRNSTGGIIGDRASSITLAQNLIIQAATHHSYDELKIIIICDKNELTDWENFRWLPHVFDNSRKERYISADSINTLTILNKFEDVLTQRVRESKASETNKLNIQLPYLLFIFTDADMTESHGIMRYLARNEYNLGAGAIFLYDNISRLPKECSVIIEVENNKGTIYSKEKSDKKEHFKIDKIDKSLLEKFARGIAPIRIEIKGGAQLPTSVSFLQGYNIKRPQELPLEANWQGATPSRSMAVPVGIKQNGEDFLFDIHEKESGPHGLVAGMTGSGKSEMIQSWILSMAVKFPPHMVSFVLIDFKGTGLILPFRNLPHLAGTISDLDTSIGRNLIALENELSRRKALLDKYGVTNISSYLKLYYEGTAQEALSYLFIVIDEFAEFRTRFPDFMTVVDRVFAIGRTLGVHIILLTQKPANIVNDKMNANTRFRWCLKVASSADSKDMLRHPDAAKITVPGRAYVQVGEDEIYEQIQSFWSGAPYNPERDPSMNRVSKISFINLSGIRTNYETEKTTGYRADKNEIDAVVDYLDNFVRKNNYGRARNIWTEKLAETVLLDKILTIAFDGETWNTNASGLYIPIGKIDDPRSQSQYPLRIAPHEDGHFVVYGAPGMGKTTFLQTVVMSTALSFPPNQINIYIMDFGGGSMNIFRDLPHIGGIAITGEDEKIDKLAKMIKRELDDRRRKFSELGIVSIDAYREATCEELPYIVLVLDNFAPVLGMYPDLEGFFINLTRDGGSYGIYLIASTGNTMSLSFRIAQYIKVSAALRMTEKGDYSAIVGRTDGLEPENLPGRGLIKNVPPLEFQTALPAPGNTENERITAIRSLCALMNEKWNGVRPSGIPVMPERITVDMLNSSDICLGLSVEHIKPVPLQLAIEPFTIISGNKGSGKSELMRGLVKQIYGKIPEVSIVLFDSPDEGLAKVKDISNIYHSTGDKFDEYIDSLIPELNERKMKYDDDKTMDFPPLVIAVDDLGHLFKNASDKTMSRFAAIMTLGRGLYIYLLVAGDISDISKLYHGGDNFTTCLVDKSTAVLLGNNFKSHGVFKADISYTESEQKLSAHEGYILRNNGILRFKAIE